MSALETIIARLTTVRQPASKPYFVPGLWIDGNSTPAVAVDPYHFYADRLRDISESAAQSVVDAASGDWSAAAIVYNLFPRVTTAFDHSGDGELSLDPTADGWRETGTLLKCIALLPYIRDLGFNTVHLLPITAIGQDGKKGNLGSPYAIRNPYRLDDRLTEPALGLSADELFAGFVEAAHRLGIRVVMEFVLRTSAKDGDWIAEHPEWFYWIRESIPDRGAGSADSARYGNPIFPLDTLGWLKWKVDSGQLHDLPAPPEAYRAFFTEPPTPDQIHSEDGRYIGTLSDGTRVRIPGAFADWPPDDSQPPWGDVTYLRLYTHPDFNYMAYNTIRMYDERLAQPIHATEPLWAAITGVIPHYQTHFGIDGVMIDMGHALPPALKQRIVVAARAIDPAFAFWDENFMIGWQSRAEGYNAVMGYWLFDVHQSYKVRDMLGSMAWSPYPIRFFAAPENHNTPRAASRPGGLAFARYAFALSVMIPGLPFMLSGLELGETQPINTGLGFSGDLLAKYAAESLPLFSAYAFDWTRADNLVAAVREILAIRNRYAALLSDDRPATFTIGHSDNPAILILTRHNQDGQVIAIANTDPHQAQMGIAVPDTEPMPVANPTAVYGNAGAFTVMAEAAIPVALAPAQVILLTRDF